MADVLVTLEEHDDGTALGFEHVAGIGVTLLDDAAVASDGAQPVIFWDPPQTNLATYVAPAVLLLDGAYVDAGVAGDTWTSALGGNFTGADIPDRTEFAGMPGYSYQTAPGEVHLQSTTTLATACGASDRYAAVCVSLTLINATSTAAPWENHGALSDSGQFWGIHFWRSGAFGSYQYWAQHYDWALGLDGVTYGIRRCNVEITSLVSAAGAGTLVVEARKHSNRLWMRVTAGGVTPDPGGWIAGEYAGATQTTTGFMRAGYRLNGTLRRAYAKPANVTDAQADQIAWRMAFDGLGLSVSYDQIVNVRVRGNLPMVAATLRAQADGAPEELVAYRGYGIAGTGLVLAPWSDEGCDFAAGNFTVGRGSLGFGSGGGSTEITFTLEAVDPFGQRTIEGMTYVIDPAVPVIRVEAFSPADGATVAPTADIGFDVVSNAATAVSEMAIEVWVVWADGEEEMVFHDGAYAARWLARPGDGAVTGGRRFRFRREVGKLRDSFTVHVRGVDGERFQVASNAYNLVVSPALVPPATTPTPPSGSTIAAADPVFLEVTSLYVDVHGARVLAHYPDADDLYELVYDAASGGFGPKFAASSSLDDGDPQAWSFSLERDGGWPAADTRLLVVGWDEELREGSAVVTFTVSDPSGIGAAPVNAVVPVVGDYDPAPGTRLSRAQPLRFSVTDDEGALVTVLVAVAFSTGVAELAHDGTRFLSPYAGSTRVPIAGGYRYTLIRSGGWPAAPTVQTIPIDTAGNVG